MLSTTPSETSGGTGTAPVEIPPILCHIRTMNKTTNPYRLQMIQQGRDPIDAPIREVPARYRDRFATYEEYQEAIAEMLNGM